MTSSGLETAAFRLVAQFLNKLYYRMPPLRHHMPPNSYGLSRNLPGRTKKIYEKLC
jgi:hypothetical protein